MAPARPFHFAFLVKDLASTRRFYGRLLGCREGRSTRTWVDFDFFGNQISAHVSKARPQRVPCGHVDAVVVPIPHFGAIVTWKEFGAIAARLRKAKMAFVVEPQVRYVGKPAEQATLFLSDFSGNSLEFKAYRNEKNVFRR